MTVIFTGIAPTRCCPHLTIYRALGRLLKFFLRSIGVYTYVCTHIGHKLRTRQGFSCGTDLLCALCVRTVSTNGTKSCIHFRRSKPMRVRLSRGNLTRAMGKFEAVACYVVRRLCSGSAR